MMKLHTEHTEHTGKPSSIFKSNVKIPGTIGGFAIRSTTGNITTQRRSEMTKHGIWNLLLKLPLVPHLPLHCYCKLHKCFEKILSGNRCPLSFFNSAGKKKSSGSAA